MLKDQQDDLFDDQPAVQSEGESKTFEEPTKADPADGKSAPDEPKQVSEEGQQGEKENASEPPAEGQEGDKGQKAEKMIPESRMKAALKDVTDRLNATQAELNKMRAIPAPDRATDPEGYERHVRMDVSKQMMMQSKPDYEEVIKHYVKMLEANPFLDAQVANHPLPAMFAYDLAKEDLRLAALRDIDPAELQEFRDWKINGKNAKTEQAVETAALESKTAKQLTEGIQKVPNLNRATNVAKAAQRAQEDDELFAGAL